MKSPFRRIVHALASLRLAVLIIVALAIVAAIGTITEARYNDSEMATQLVYQSPWMYGILGLLILNLIAVMVDRWPWKQHHTGFVMAHIGIISLLLGAWVTKEYGVDGSIAFEIGESRRIITIKDRGFMVFASLNNGNLRTLHEGPADFIRHPPTEKKPYVVPLGSSVLKVTDFYPFAFRESEILNTDSQTDGPAVRFQIENPHVNLTQWIRFEKGKVGSELDLGPAKVVFAHDKAPEPSGRNEIIVVNHENSDKLDYFIYSKEKQLRKKGQIRQSETIETGWMGLKFRLLRYLPHAIENIRYTAATYATPMTTSAILVQFADKKYWVGLDSPFTLRDGEFSYIIVYGHRQISLPFALHLLKFNMGKYQGTQRASSYESEVDVPGRGRVVISMNEPLKEGGFTFYQSSFEQNERGEPTISVLSVNRDPGRWIKYFGSLLIVLGAVILFYFKRVKWIQTQKRSPA